MNKQAPRSKRIVVHVGPHKTGSTAIQKWLGSNGTFLEKNSLQFIHTVATHRAAKLIANEAYAEAESSLADLSLQIGTSAAQTVIISQEDFAGDLPGRSRRRGLYPRLLKNLRVIKRALSPHVVTFVFFERPELEWLRSCYHQHLLLRTQFSDFTSFQEFFNTVPSWDQILQKTEESLNDSIIRVKYSISPDAGVRSVLAIAGLPNARLPSLPSRVNSSPNDAILASLERVNRLTSFPQTAWFAKRLLVEGWRPRAGRPISHYEHETESRSASVALPELLKRAMSRFPIQEAADDLLPDVDADLSSLATRLLPREVALPAVSRASLRDQSSLLDYHLRGKSELAKLNALLISYLRRNTRLTVKAATLFHRVWREHGVLLINELSSRWLISTLQTFLDYGENEGQRLIGACGYFYANLIKIYESERAVEGLEQDGVLSGTEPRTASKFRGLDRFKVGGTDLLVNVNSLALDISMQDDVAGIVLQEFLLRVKCSGNVFTRADATRVHFNVENEEFRDTWSFFCSPEGAGSIR